MSSAELILRSWSFDGWAILPAVLVGGLYVRGWVGLHRARPARFPPWRLWSFLGGLAVMVLSVFSPVDALGALLLQAHMLQHLLLAIVAPVLLLAGWPALPVLRGLPATVRRDWLGPFMASGEARRVVRAVTHPIVCLSVYTVVVWGWHFPAAYELALRSPAWHRVEHASFLVAGLLLWWPVVRPFPFAPHWPRWTIVPYLLLASVQNTVFSAVFAFSDRVFYPTYAATAPLLGWRPIDDQAAAGALMWVPGSVAMLVPVVWLVHDMMSPRGLRRPQLAAVGSDVRGGAEGRLAAPGMGGRVVTLPQLGGDGRGAVEATPARRGVSPGPDLLRAPVIGRVIASRGVRTSVRALLFLAAAAIVVDGLLGPQLAPLNLAGVLPWTHWRGFIVIALLVAGNAFCMTCPFVLPRRLGARWFGRGRPWPRMLRSKWVAVSLVAIFLVAYEAFDLWDSPWWTAWIVLGYGVAAFAVDAVFRGTSFCKYVCPIGQFQFVQSLVSPLQVMVRDPGVCARCTTHDCIRGRPATASASARPGCGTDLFLPRKRGNLDCTFCLDCADACPHDNVGMIATMPGSQLLGDPPRSSIGRIAERTDVAALVAVLAFGAMANAAGMVGPVLDLRDRLAEESGAPRWLVAGVMLVAAAVVLPGVVVPVIGWVGARLAGGPATSTRRTTNRMVLALVPLGAAMWFAHLFFHLATSVGTVIPVTQRVINALGGAWAGAPQWVLACCAVPPEWLLPLELAVLGAGVVMSVTIAWFTAVELTSAPSRALRLVAPWVMLLLLGYGVGAWILFQPMEMRGTMTP